MKPPIFDYLLASSLDQAVAALAGAGGEGKVLAGGQSLMPMLNFRLLRPALLVDINRLSGLAGIEMTAAGLRIGALARHRALETSPLVARHLPILQAAMRHVAHLAIRNRGTLGGSLAHADPAAELPMLACLLDAEIAVAGPAGRRRIAAGDFFTSALQTSLAPQELVCDVTFACPPAGAGWAFEEVARRHGDFALAGIGIVLQRAGDRIAEARIAAMGVAERPLRAVAAEAELRGARYDSRVCAQAVAALIAQSDPSDDLHGSAAYRRHVLAAIGGRNLDLAWQRAGGAAA